SSVLSCPRRRPARGIDAAATIGAAIALENTSGGRRTERPSPQSTAARRPSPQPPTPNESPSRDKYGPTQVRSSRGEPGIGKTGPKARHSRSQPWGDRRPDIDRAGFRKHSSGAAMGGRSGTRIRDKTKAANAASPARARSRPAGIRENPRHAYAPGQGS